jgi:hypothetical protein
MHLLALWNPSYADDPLEAHLAVLLDRVRQWRAGAIPDEDVAVWWGLIKSSNRLAPLPHLDELRALAAAMPDETQERHLYLTDYRSLVVADLTEIAFEEPGEGEPIPAYYAAQDFRCDAWLRLADIRVLVRDDLPGVIRELRLLRNTRYHDKPVSLYGGMVELPLIVTRDDDQTWFTEADMAPLDEQCWVEFDRTHGSAVGRMSLELRDHLLGDVIWERLHPTSRTFLATAETEWRDRQGDAGHDPSGVLLQFAKVVELETNRALRRLLSRVPASARLANLDGRTEDLLSHPPLTLGQLAHVLQREADLCRAVDSLGSGGHWFVTEWPPQVGEWAEHRNAASHTGTVTKRQALSLRNRLLGVGCEGALGRVVGVG